MIDINGFVKEGPSKERVKEVEKFVKDEMKEKLETQIRKIFNELKTLEMKGYKEGNGDVVLPIVKARIAYMTARKEDLKKLKEVIDKGIDMILEAGEEDQETFFKNFMRMLEVIVAYYKLHKKSKGGE